MTRMLRTAALTAALAFGVWTLAVTLTPIASAFSAGDEVSATAFNDLFAAIGANFDSAATAITANEEAVAANGAAVAALQAPEAVRAGLSSNATVNDGSVFKVPFDLEAFDIGDFHDPTTDPTRFVVPRDGIYRVAAALTWSSNPNGSRTLAVTRNNVTQLGDSRGAIDGLISQSTGGLLPLNEGDVLEVLAIQDSGSPLTLISTAQVSFDMDRVGDLP